MTTALALCASLLWGTSDFLGGTAARRLPVTAGIEVKDYPEIFSGLILLAIILFLPNGLLSIIRGPKPKAPSPKSAQPS